MGKTDKNALFAIPLYGNRVAHVPLHVLEQYVVEGATLAHPVGDSPNDVTAHHMTVEGTSGHSEWHLEYEYGPCEYRDDNGQPIHGYVRHRHPFGTEYAEIFEK
jgi:hypothetical protein